jgi:type I restriction-modification system DNA methylase subunit
MTNKEIALAKISELITRFDELYEGYKNPEYNETQARRDFIDPFFKSLGWDVDNENGYAESYREVIHEDKVKVSGETKAPDYSFRLVGGKRLFFVEAKKPSVYLKEDIIPAYQVRRYGWSAKLPISIITDFEEFAVYDCTKKPLPNDNASVARIKYLNYKDYISEFEFIWNTFSKERVLKGSFDKFIQSDTYKKGTATVDKEFLISLDRWRTALAANVSWNNKLFNEDEINFAVQQFIDRIIFLRIAEDRAIEPYGSLKQVIQNDNFYENLYQKFQFADDKYNSGLFDFKKDQISKNLIVDNKVIKSIISELYYPDCPYEFSVLSIEILGSAYEQFLGKQIKIDKAHKAHIEEKIEVRKAGGVYYTPQYIVDFIVENTVGKLIERKTPKEVSKIKICDPACGSGSFLIGTYQFLLDWHKNFFTSHGKISKGSKNNPITPEGNLTTAEKKRILLNNIFGVDLDVNAVEVTKLSLLLKCMEGETEASISSQLRLFNERVLPTIDSNIRSGNSLIDTDFYENLLDFGEDKKIKPFNWANAFPEVFQNGGFDAVIGNPPYGAEISKDQQKYFIKKFPISNTDTAALFIIQAQGLLKNKGYNGFIVPKAFTFASNYEKTRAELLRDLNLIVDCSKVWSEVKLEMSIYLSQKNSNTPDYASCIRIGKEISRIGKVSKNLCQEFNFFLNGLSDKEILIGQKIASSPQRLPNVINNRRGAMLQSFVGNEGDTFVLGGKQIQRYSIEIDNSRKINQKEVLDSMAHISLNSILVQNIVAHIQNPFPHILIIASVPNKDITETCVLLDTVNQLENKSRYSTRFILGFLNSTIVNWYVYRFIYANAIRTMHFDSPSTNKIPFPSLNMNEKKDKAMHDEVVKQVEEIIHLKEEIKNVKLPTERDQIKTHITYSEGKINRIICDLFGLTSEEMEIIK